jgi:hypothetical protein
MSQALRFEHLPSRCLPPASPRAGHLVSAFVKQHLPLLLVDHLASGCTPAVALAEGFLEVDARLGASRIDCEFSGSTCVVAYMRVRAQRRAGEAALAAAAGRAASRSPSAT